MSNRYVVRDSEAGNEIESFSTLEEAENFLQSCENDDEKHGIYEEDFYEIYDKEKELILL